MFSSTRSILSLVFLLSLFCTGIFLPFATEQKLAFFLGGEPLLRVRVSF